MRLTKEKTEAINRRADEMKRTEPYKSSHIIGIGIEVGESLGETKVKYNGLVLFDIEDISQAIKELEFIRQALEDESGIIV